MNTDPESSTEIPEDADEETTPDEEEVEEEADPESIRRARQKLDDDTISDDLREEIEDRVEEWEQAESDSEREKVEDALERITYDALDEHVEIAREHAEIVERYRDEAPEGSMDRIGWDMFLDKEQERVQEMEERTQSFKKWERDCFDEIRSDLAQGRITSQEAERRCERIEERRKKLRRKTTFNAAGMDDLDDTLWEQRMLVPRATQPDVVEKAEELRDMMKDIPWHEREDVLGELADQADIDEETLNEIKDWIL